MGRITVNAVGNDQIAIVKSPGILSWSIFVGVVSLGFGSSIFGSDHIIYNIAFIIGCSIFGACLLEDWESCLVDRNIGQIDIWRANAFQKFLRFNKKREFKIDISSIMSVRAQLHNMEEKSNYCVVFIMKSGLCLPLFESIMGNRNFCDCLSEKLLKFMRLCRVENVTQGSEESLYFSDESNSSSDESETNEALLMNLEGRPREIVTTIREGRIGQQIL